MLAKEKLVFGLNEAENLLLLSFVLFYLVRGLLLAVLVAAAAEFKY